MTSDDRTETITDRAAIRDSDEADPWRITRAHVGNTTCGCGCAELPTPAPASVATVAAPDLDAIERTLDHLSSIGLRDASSLVAEVRSLRAKVELLKRGGAELGRILDHTLTMALDASGLHDVIDEDGDGDWEVVWETLAGLRPRAEAAEAEVVTLRAELAALQVAVSHSAESCADGPCEFHETESRAESAEAKVAAVEALVAKGIRDDSNGYRNGAADALDEISAALSTREGQ